jgi:hypothetical protein
MTSDPVPFNVAPVMREPDPRADVYRSCVAMDAFPDWHHRHVFDHALCTDWFMSRTVRKQHFRYPAPSPTLAHAMPRIDAHSGGPCSVEFTVTDVQGNAVYGVNIACLMTSLVILAIVTGSGSWRYFFFSS